MKKTLKIMSAGCAAVMLFNAAAFAEAGETAASISVGGNKIEFSSAPFEKSGETYIPLREFLEKASAKTEIIWNNDKTLILNGSYENSSGETVKTKAEFAIDKTAVNIQGNELSLKNPPLLIDGKTYISEELAIALDEKAAFTEGFEISSGSDEVLEKALVWAKALKDRDGKPRYEIMTEEMQNKFVEEQKTLVNSNEWNYVIGTSSPKTVSYDIITDKDTATIYYLQADNTEELYSHKEVLSFENKDGILFVSKAE